MDGRLLVTARPYLQVLAIFTLTPPPSCYADFSNIRHWWALVFGYIGYVFATLLLGLYVAYINNVAIIVETDFYELEDFTKSLGQVQKCIQAFALITIHLNMAIQYRRLANIYVAINDLEMDIENANRYYAGHNAGSKCISLRLRLFLSCGLWFIILMVTYTPFVYPALGFLNDFHRAITGWMMVILQTKCVEYCVFVVLVQELLKRLHCTLMKLQYELADCQRQDMLQALCAALRQNQHFLGRIWHLVGEIENYFMLPMLCLFLNNGMALLHVVNWSYIQALNPKDCCRYTRYGNMFLLLLNVFVACWLSQSCANTYKRFRVTIHNCRGIRSSSNFTMLTMAIREYCLQLQHLRVRFTCGGFFDFNLKCFGTMILTIVSYTVILIQFKLQSIAKASNGSNVTALPDKSV